MGNMLLDAYMYMYIHSLHTENTSIQELYESPHKEFVKRLQNMISFSVVSVEFLRFWVEKRCREMIYEHIETMKPFVNHSLLNVYLLG